MDELAKLRKSLGLTQEQAAEMIGINRKSWSRYETGARKISPQLLELFKLKAGLSA